MRHLIAAFALGALLAASVGDAAACACCTNRGQRNVGTQDYDSGARAQVDDMTFQPRAEVYVGEGDYEFIEGINAAQAGYAMAVSRETDRIVFSFTGETGRAGSLTLKLPQRLSVFEVDTRDTPDAGLGPGLYKEWKLTGTVSGTGDFAAASAAGHHLTLILHGHGNSCTSSIDFSHWTLVMEGPKANYTMIGDLKQAAE
jgi:hypothetical protein